MKNAPYSNNHNDFELGETCNEGLLAEKARYVGTVATTKVKVNGGLKGNECGAAE